MHGEEQLKVTKKGENPVLRLMMTQVEKGMPTESHNGLSRTKTVTEKELENVQTPASSIISAPTLKFSFGKSLET